MSGGLTHHTVYTTRRFPGEKSEFCVLVINRESNLKEWLIHRDRSEYP